VYAHQVGLDRRLASMIRSWSARARSHDSGDPPERRWLRKFLELLLELLVDQRSGRSWHGRRGATSRRGATLDVVVIRPALIPGAIDRHLHRLRQISFWGTRSWATRSGGLRPRAHRSNDFSCIAPWN